jgi:flagellar biosynthetic protein FliO
MFRSGRPADPRRLMARRPEVQGLGVARGGLSTRRIGAIALVVGLAIVAFVGAVHPLPVAGGVAPAANSSALLSAASTGSVWDTGTGGFDVLDLAIKCVVVLALLFVCLRVLARLQTPARKRGSRLEVLESRPLAPKASLHLVAVGERRLVIGLTPNGMVSLAELDASELTEVEADAALDADGAAAVATAGGFGAAAGSRRPAELTLPSFLGPLAAPLDALTGRLVAMLSGGRAR